MKYTFGLMLFLICLHGYSQSFKEYELKTEIKEVTVFLQGAQISREGESDIVMGKSELIIKSISSEMDEKSIQVKGTGDFTILGVNHRVNYLNQHTKDNRIDSLKNIADTLDIKISSSNSRLEVLQEKENLLAANRKLTGDNLNVSIEELRGTLEFFDQQLSAIKKEKLAVRRDITEQTKRKDLIEKQIADASSRDDLPTSEIVIRVEAGSKTKGSFSISYMVEEAGWYPNYDVRVESVDRPLILVYKASAYQNTGVDWKDVRLKFSNGVPSESGVVPELSTWHLNYARNTVYNRPVLGVANIRAISGQVLDESGEPLIGANIVVKGTTIGTITDMDGKYSLVLPNGATSVIVTYVGYESKEQLITSSRMNITLSDPLVLEEVVVTALQGQTAGVRIKKNQEEDAEQIPTTIVENRTTVDFEIETPYTIKSNGELLSIELNQFEIMPSYDYYVAPKLDKDAFLLAKIVNWDQYNLLEGEANLYFEDSYVGRTILDSKTLVDTLNVSLGRDKSIVLERTKIDDFTKKRTIGSNKVESRGFKIIARNSKSSAIRITIQDQIPISAISDITVTATELSQGMLDEQTGKVTWQLDLAPKGQKEIIFSYEVKYPKRESVILE